MMSFYWTCYNTATGEITSSGATTSPPDVPQATSDLGVIDGQYHGATHYVNLATGAVVPKPALPIADQEYEITVGEELVLQVPVGTWFRKNPIVKGVVDDGTLEIMGEKVESFDLMLRPPFPFLETKIKVTVS